MLILNKYPELYAFGALLQGVSESDVSEFIRSIEDDVRKKYTLEYLPNEPVIRAYRDFFWSIGIDPTKERPSSEALIRRILRGKPLPRINPVVDIMNAISALTGIVMSVFDADKIELPVILRPATGVEKLRIIGGKEIVIPEGFPILEGKNGKVFSATVYRDGEETKVTNQTQRVLLVVYLPKALDKALGLRAMRIVVDAIREKTDARVVEIQR